MIANQTPPKSRRSRRWLSLLLLFVVLLVAIPAVALPVWSWRNSAEPAAEALLALQSDDVVSIQDDATRDWITFSPMHGEPSTGLVFYPGGLVPPAAYALPLKEIAARGFLVVVPAMPLNLAVFDSNRAQAIIAAYPEVENWVIGGHSLGGAMAARFAADHPLSLSGLVLWASYPSGGSDLASTELAVLSLYGTHDGVLNRARFDEGLALLPADAEVLPIEGGNHAQFGSYGEQGGDLPAAISAAEQQQQIVDQTVAFLARFQP